MYIYLVTFPYVDFLLHDSLVIMDIYPLALKSQCFDNHQYLMLRLAYCFQSYHPLSRPAVYMYIANVPGDMAGA